ncbi:hypothetical protein PVAP13_6KG380800 [Panicum virgatum]|uniref:GOLD domain-containing protein n=1 Tax=Panicum virgatum TaxID=38727 RepID=A0A8T0RKX8_PANVG|nr:hypothetical protein PVAP13_6KG380800 [Panicum virgatum]
MEGLSWGRVCLSVLCVVLLSRPAAAIRFVIDREECFSHNVEYEGDTVHVSFVVIKAETPWHYSEEGVDLVVKDPNGAQVRDSRDKTSDKFEFIVQKRGVHRFCFTNKSPYHETIDFDVHVGHFSYFEQHAKDGKNLWIPEGLLTLVSKGLASSSCFLDLMQNILLHCWSKLPS